MQSIQSSQTNILVKEVERSISKIGVMFRLFYREKTNDSLFKKANKNPGKYGADKKVQDIVGIRIALYFIDDVIAVQEILEKTFEHLSEFSQIDKPQNESFKAIRRNLIFRLPEYFDETALIDEQYHNIVDKTFEVQIRTILSEGWHEVDHDLRYKCQDDWIGLDSENRAFNGVYATLETSEWTLLKLFEDLSYTHYKSGNIKAMLQNKFRLRIRDSLKDAQTIKEIVNRPELVKAIFRYDRSRLFSCIATRPAIPINYSNIIYIANLDEIQDEKILSMIPPTFLNWWNQA